MALKYITKRPQFFEAAREIAARTKIGFVLFEFSLFVFKQGWAALFGGLLLALIIMSRYWYPFDDVLHRYDFLFLAAIGIQLGLIAFKLETISEAKIIILFHIVGTVMEIFKTAMGSWIYPEASLFHIGGVPLFSGFMYSAVGSYIARVWRAFDFRFEGYPRLWQANVVALLIYINFFSHHYVPDIRYGLFAALLIIYFRTKVFFRVDRQHYAMPLLVGFFLVAIFIWFGEQIGTLAQAWRYPNQTDGWRMVSFGKLGSWYLLMIISFVMVTWLHVIKAVHRQDDRLRSKSVALKLHTDDEETAKPLETLN